MTQLSYLTKTEILPITDKTIEIAVFDFFDGMGAGSVAETARCKQEARTGTHMSSSDVRRGPGWWMDLEGGWNPPEEWPEPTPPLPGWVRNDEGSWRPPTDEEGAVREPTPSEVAEDQRSVPNHRVPRATAQEPDHRSPLRYATHHRHARDPETQTSENTTARRALSAAALAAITASMIAGGMVLLLLLL